ncbi:hypothetical protein WJX74_004193 [Apatococcus lobatus]|uniref:Yippee domain-containing protein n=1 Tax=Apatococcus lobatus TaxID=904363 RepID=A0AAW1RQG6_9CHLO
MGAKYAEPSTVYSGAAADQTGSCRDRLAAIHAISKNFTMGRPFLSHITEDRFAKYTCASCGADIASHGQLLWEGYMGVRQPALLFTVTLNLDTAASLREEQLSTGCYVLADVTCRACSSPMGWSYLHASNEEQKYKEGCTLLQKSMLKKVPAEDPWNEEQFCPPLARSFRHHVTQAS